MLEKSVRCVNCRWAVLMDQPPDTCLCWREADGTRKPMDVNQERKCSLYALGYIDQLKIRPGFNPKTV